jgi:uncharacterized protein
MIAPIKPLEISLTCEENPMKKCGVCRIITILASIGAINWLLLALFQVDLVVELLGGMSAASKAVYITIGIAGILLLVTSYKPCPCTKQSAK